MESCCYNTISYTRAKIEKKKRVKKSIILANFGTEILGQWYPQDIIGRATLFDIFACAANQKPGGGGGGKCISARAFPVWPAKWRVLQRAVCHSAWRIGNSG